MKNLYSTLLLTSLLFCLGACKKSNEFELKGEMEGITSNMLLVVYDDPESRLDTIYPRNGKFTYSFIPDTTTIFRLIDDSGTTVPIFAEKGWKVSIKGSLQNPEIKGEGANKEYQDFQKSIYTLQDSTQIRKKAQEFIQTHPQSYASAYILYEIFTQTNAPDPALIHRLAEPLTGKIKDCRILNDVLKNITEKEKQTKDPSYLNYLSIKKRDGSYISWSNKATQYTLINFWASWDKESRRNKDSLYRQIRNFPKDQLRIINFSLDYDKREWTNCCKEDTEQWIEVCDTKGWKNSLLNQLQIHKLPFNILIDQNRKILGRNLQGEALEKEIETLTRENKEQK